MADLEFYQDDSDENSEDDYGFDSGLGEVEDLTSLQRLEKYLDNDNIYNRQMLARGLLDTLRSVCETGDDCVAVLNAMTRLSEDPEPSVRSELMEQVPHVAVYCQENSESFTDAVPKYILPMVVRYLNDANSQVRKTSQAALLVLLEQELVEKSDIEHQVVQVILELAAPESLDDYRSEAVALMSKMAPLLGKEVTELHFLPRFSEMCTDPLFHVRKVCAANFGEMAGVVGVKSSEEILLPKFYYLCEDGVWGVRKACAECFMTVSHSCSQEMRKNELANLFINLLCDQSRWVRMSAYQQLGPFISTFADANRTDLFVNEDGTFSFRSSEEFEESTAISSEVQLNEGSSSSVDDSDLNGILQLTPLDPPGIPRESSSDAGNSSNNSQLRTEEGMCVDEGEEDVGRLALTELDKSLEELRASVWLAAASDYQSRDSQCGGAGDSSKAENVSTPSGFIAQSSACDKFECENSGSGDDGSGASHTSIVAEERLKENNAVDTGPATESDIVGEVENDTSSSDKDTVEIENTEKTELSVSNLATTTESEVEKCTNVVECEKDKIVDLFSSPPLMNANVEGSMDTDFNSFQFWRQPLPEVKIDLDILNAQPTNIHMVIHSSNPETTGSSSVTLSPQSTPQAGARIHTASVSTVRDGAEETVAHIGSTHVLGQHMGEQHFAVVDGIVQDLSSSLSFTDNMSSLEFGMDDAALAQQQSVVPQPLLENYLGMVDPGRAQTVDGEITKHCAYNLPAVAYTLGRHNWHCIKNLYETLAQDMQWKVRRTLAFSIHELALIVGEEITHKDLVPVFDGFLKDLDEVRIGVLKHLADIFKLLRPDVRLQYLAKTPDFMKTDNNKNWRFREELAEQLIETCSLFHCVHIVQYVVPLGMAMLMDKVAQVRLVALRLVSAVLKKTFQDGEKQLLASVCNNIIEQFATDYRWLFRQTFAQLCYAILEMDALPPSVFAKNFLPSVLALSSDPVPNVRLSLSKLMAQRIMPLDYFTSQQNPYHEDLVQTQQKLQSDTDKDVRYFAAPHPETIIPEHDMVPV